MTVAEIIAEVQRVKPNQYPKETLTRWLSQIEGQAVEQVINHAVDTDVAFDKYDYELDQEKELQIPDRYSDVYIHYLSAQIDQANREFASYNNDVALFESAWREYAAWHIRTHRQKPTAAFRWL